MCVCVNIYRLLVKVLKWVTSSETRSPHPHHPAALGKPVPYNLYAYLKQWEAVITQYPSLNPHRILPCEHILKVLGGLTQVSAFYE